MVNKIKNYVQQYYLVGIVLVFFGLFPAFLKSKYILNILTMFFIWGVVATSWDLILGYASVFSFGHLGFMLVGGYTSGLLAMYLNISPWLGMLAGGVTATIASLIIGIPCLRLEGLYLAIATFAFQLVLPTFVVWAGPGRFENFSTGGSYGLQPIPSPSFFGYSFSQFEPIPWYYLMFGVFIIFQLIIYLIIKSPIGLAFIALRDSEMRAKTLGIDEYKYKLLVFAISGFIVGVMGGVYAHYLGFVSPVIVSLDTMLLVIVMVMFGGIGDYPGAALGALIITILNELLRVTLSWRLVILGSIVVLVMILFPDGLMGIPEAIKGLSKRLSHLSPVKKEAVRD